MDVVDPKQRSQRHRRRQRAARMQKQAAAAAKGAERRGSGEEGDDESPARQKAHRPPTRKKRNKEPIAEEDIIDGFSILSFRTYEDLELSIGNSLNFGGVKNQFEPKLDTGQWKDSPRVGLIPCDVRPNSVIETNLKIVENNNRVSPEPLLTNNITGPNFTPNRLSPTHTPTQQTTPQSNHVVTQNRLNRPVSPCTPITPQYRPATATVSNSTKPKIMTNQPAPGVKVPVPTRVVKTESKRPESPAPATIGQAVSLDPPSQGSSSYHSQSAATPTTPLVANAVVKIEKREEAKTGNATSAVGTPGGQAPTVRSLSPNPAQVDRLVNRNHVLVRHPVNKILPTCGREETSECAVIYPGQAKEEVVAQAVSRVNQDKSTPPPSADAEEGPVTPVRVGVNNNNPLCNGNSRSQPRPTAINTNGNGTTEQLPTQLLQPPPPRPGSGTGNGPVANANSNNTATGHLSDVSSRSSSGRGYMCDSESDDERVCLKQSKLLSVQSLSLKMSVATAPTFLDQGSDADASSDLFNNSGSTLPVSIKRETDICPRLNDITTTTENNPRPQAPGTPLLATPPTTPPPLGPPLVLAVEKSPIHPQPPILLENGPKLDLVPPTGHSLSNRPPKSGSRTHWSREGLDSPARVVSPSAVAVMVPATTATTKTLTSTTVSPSLSAIDSPRDKLSLAAVLGNAIAPVTLSSSSDSNSSISAATGTTKTTTIFSPAASLINDKHQLSPGPMGPLSFLGGVRDSYTGGGRKEVKSENSIPNSFTNIAVPAVNSLHSLTPPVLPFNSAGGHLVGSIPQSPQQQPPHQSRSDRSPILPFHSVANHFTGYSNPKKQSLPNVGSSSTNGPLVSLPPPPAPLYSPLSPHPYPRPASSSPLLGLQSSVPPKTGYIAPPLSSGPTVPLTLSASPILPNLVPVTNALSSVMPHVPTTTRTDTSPSVAVTGSGTPVPASTTPTPSMCSGRDSHSAHSSSSISSLSQLSQSLGHSSTGHKETNREAGSSGSNSSGSGRSRSNSRNNTPCISSASSLPPPPLTVLSTSVSSAIVPNCASVPCSSSYPSSTYNSAGLTSLVFSKPSWVSTSANPILGSLNGTHLTPPLPTRPTPPPGNPSGPSLPLPPSLHNSHHSSPYGPHLPGAPPPVPPPSALHPSGPGGPHSSIFAPPIPPPSSLTPSNLGLGPSPTGAPFSADSLFSQPRIFNPNSSDTDLLRRELDTRFLASQDRSIAIPPPPYMRSEMHQHQHTHMHQHGPFLPPPPPSLSGGSTSMSAGVQQPPPQQGPAPPPPHMQFDKFPKMPDSPFYGRNSLGLPGYPPMGPILGPPGASSNTPFAPAGHLAAFQPKLNPLVKSKNVKSGRWCAMHVRIAWEIYHHQQKPQSDAHKGNPGMVGGPGKSPADLLRPPGGMPGGPPGNQPHSLFPSLTGRSPHDISALSSSLLAASAGNHGRPFEPHHNSFLAPSAAHLSVSPYGRPGAFPTFGPPPGTGFGGLGSLGQFQYCLTGASLFGGRDPRSCLAGPLGPVGGPPGGVDPMYGPLHHRTPPAGAYPPSSSASSVGPPGSSGSTGGASWGGLKAEAERERERMQREEQEREQREREREQQRIREEKQREQREKEQQRLREEKQRLEKEQMEKERERREQERQQKERDRENRLTFQAQQQQLQQLQHHHNGDLMMERLRDPRDHHRDHWEVAAHRSSRDRERKERASLNRSSSNSSAFDNNGSNSGGTTSHHDHRSSLQAKPPEVKVKEEKKDDVVVESHPSHHHPPPQHLTNHHERMLHEATPPGSDYLRSLQQQQRASPASIAAAMNLTHPLDRVRLMRSLPPMGPVESQSPHSQVPPHFWGPLGTVQGGGPPSANGSDLRDTLRSLEYHHHQQQRDMREREFLHRYAGLGSVVGPPHHHPSHDRYREAEFARHLVAAGDLDRQLQMERQYDRSKLGPPPLRTNELPPTFPSALSSVFPSMSMVPRLGGMPTHPGPPLGLPLRSSKNGSPSSSTGIPPPLIPCSIGSGSAPNTGVSPPILNHKLGLSNPGSILENDNYFTAKDRREMALHPEIDSQSR